MDFNYEKCVSADGYLVGHRVAYKTYMNEDCDEDDYIDELHFNVVSTFNCQMETIAGIEDIIQIAENNTQYEKLEFVQRIFAYIKTLCNKPLLMMDICDDAHNSGFIEQNFQVIMSSPFTSTNGSLRKIIIIKI